MMLIWIWPVLLGLLVIHTRYLKDIAVVSWMNYIKLSQITHQNVIKEHFQLHFAHDHLGCQNT